MILLYLFMVFESMYYPNSVFSEHLHDAAFQRHGGWHTGIGVRSHYGVPGVHTYTVAIARGSALISGVSFGCDAYRENRITAAYGSDILLRLRAGAGISVLNYWVRDHYSRCGYAVHVSAHYDLGALEIGGWLNNMNVPRFNETDVVPMVYSIRTRYAIHDGLACILAARGTHERLPFFNAGIAWTVHRYLEVGFGANTEPSYAEYMVRLPLGHLEIHYTGTLHEYLGLSHAMRIMFNLQ